MKRKKSHKNKHHIIPKSRKKIAKGENVVFIDKKKHADYHILFSNRTPVEIIEYLVNYFWGGRTEFLIDAIEEIERRNYAPKNKDFRGK